MKFYLLLPIRYFNWLLRILVSWSHKVEQVLQWRLPPYPEWYDHFGDQYCLDWGKRGNGFWVERGAFSRLVMKPGGRVIEVCCGDGFNTQNFYANCAREILAVDFDQEAIWHAKRFHSARNIEYRIFDIRQPLAQLGVADNVVWDAAIEHFTPAEIAAILGGIVGILGAEGILSGYTLVEKGDGEKHLHQHEREFKDKDDLRSLLTPHFAHVYVWETVYPQRHNLYFWCSQKPINIIA